MTISTIFLVPAAFAGGVVASVAGGGAFLTFPALMLTGLDPRAANITSTIAMYPMQVSTGFTGRKNIAGTRHLSFQTLLIISLIGGIIGAILLMVTSPSFFAKVVPWLLLFATSLFGWGAFRRRLTPTQARQAKPDRLGKSGAMLVQFLISVYGGYFGGGIGLLMLATLTAAGMSTRQAGNTKNILAAAMNTSAVGVFLLTANIHWYRAMIVAIAATAGGLIGVQILNKFDERWLNIIVVSIGLIMTAVLFARAPH